MVVKEIQVNVSHKGGRLEQKRENTYYVIEEFLSNGCVMLHDLHMNMIDLVPIPAGHLKKILPENEANSDNDECTQDKYGKRKQNTISSMSTNTNTNMETKNTDRDFNGVRMSNTNATPNTNTNVTSIDTSNEQTIEIMEKNTDESFNGATMHDTNIEPNKSMTVTSIKNSNEQSDKQEGIDNDMMFTSNKEDNFLTMWCKKIHSVIMTVIMTYRL